MIQRDIKNSSGKITGKTIITEDKIIIDNIGKSILEIIDDNIIKEVLSNNIGDNTLIALYEEYTMSIGEIASLYNRCYSNINKKIKALKISTNHKGRRNRAYGHQVSAEQSKKMSQSLRGRKAPEYERTPEIKFKISNSLRKYYKNNPQDPQPHIDNWKRGIYDNVNFQRGIAGHFTSIKMNKTFRFRSLLELYFMLLIEKDIRVITYDFEPFHITMDNGHTYMPDFIINNSIIIELKSKKFIERIEGVQRKVEYKQSQARKYCKNNNYVYKIVYDEDINFESRKMKKYLRDNSDIINKYNIVFQQPERIWSKK